MAGEERPCSQLLLEVETGTGRQRHEVTLAKRPIPRFEPVSGPPEGSCRVDPDGWEIVGWIVSRVIESVGIHP